MKAGKISESQLKRSVLKQLHKDSFLVAVGPMVGGDFAAVTMEENEMVVLSSNPVTGDSAKIGRRIVFEALNDVVVSGAAPVGVLCSVLFPTVSNEAQLRELMRDIDEAAAACNTVVLGGHTEVTRAVKEPVVSLTGVGKVKRDRLVTAAMAEPGMDILLTNWIALEGTAIIAAEKENELLTRYSAPFIRQAREFEEYLSVVTEAAVAVNAGVAAMHNVSQGGIFGALWEMAQASGIGLEIDLKKIPVRQETIEICEYFDVNPYKLLSGGAILMAAKDGNRVVRMMEQAGKKATIIGKATEGNDRVLLYDDERRFLETPQTDELLSVFSE